MAAIYSIYISRYKNTSGTVTNSETLMYSIPITSDSQAEKALLEPKLKVEMGKTGSFEFSVTPLNPYYSSWLQMKTIMRVEFNGETIFRGRVLTIDDERMTGNRRVHLEGDMAFLMDSIQSGTKEEDRTKISVLTYLNNLLDVHNSQMNVSGSTHKKIYIGEVPGNYSGNIASYQKVTAESRKYGDNSWRSTSDILSSLKKEFGGYFRTRYVASENKCYLDWLDHSFNSTVNTQQIKLKENLIDVTTTTEVDNLFTALIPIGSKEGKSITIKGYKTNIHGNNEYILVPQIVGQVSDSVLNKGYHNIEDFQNAVDDYGIIYKTQSFPNADTQAKLWTYAVDWIANNYVGGISNFSIKAIDMHHADPNIQPYFVGDRVKIVYPVIGNHVKGINNTNTGDSITETKTLTIISIDYDLYHPENNTYNIGIPSDTLGKTYGETIKKSSGSSSANAAAVSAAGGGIQMNLGDLESEISQRVWDFIIDKTHHSEEWQRLERAEPNMAKQVLNSSHLILTKEITTEGELPTVLDKVRSTILDGYNRKLVFYPPPDNMLQVPPTEDQIQLLYEQAGGLIVDGEKELLDFKTKFKLNKLDDPAYVAKHAQSTLMRMQADLEKMEAGYKIYSWNENTEGKGDSPETVAATGGTPSDPIGKLLGMNIFSGLSAQPGDSVIKLDGLKNAIDLTSIFNKGDFSLENLTASMTGEDGGALEVGKEDDDPSMWAITLNRPIEYTDPETGQKIRLSKTIHAEDFHVNEIGSFKTKLGVFDELIAGKATIGDLETERARIGELETTVTDQGIEINQTIKGSALWAKKDDITGVVGKFKIKIVNNKEVLVVESGGGFRVHENNADMGLYMTDSGGNTVLTGGIMVEKLNDNSVTTKIKGARVDIEASQVRVGNTSGVEKWMSEWMSETGETLDEYEGAIMQRATIGQLETQIGRIDELTSKAITTETLESEIGKITTIQGKNVLLSGTITAGDVIARNNLYIGSMTNPISSGVKSVRIDGPTNNTYTLQYQTYASGAWTDAGTFSRAVSSIVWGWTGGKAKATVKPTNQVFTSPALDTFSKDGDPTWASNKKSFTQKIAVYDEDGTKVYSDVVDSSFSTVESWNAGYDVARGYAAMPGAGTGTTFAVKVPNAARTGSEDKTFTITKGTPASSGYASVSISGTVVGRIDISDWYSGGWNTGYDKAKSYAIMPSSGTGETFIVKVPNAARTGSDSKTFSITKGTPSTSGYAAVNLSGTVVGRIDISDWYKSGYSDGWDAACGKISRSGNVITCPKAGTATDGTVGKTETKYTAKYTPSAYTKEAHSYTASKYTASEYTRSYNTFTKGSMKYSGATVTTDSTINLTNYTGSVVFKQATNSYSASYYKQESYTESTHSYTPSKYTASTFTWA